MRKQAGSSKTSSKVNVMGQEVVVDHKNRDEDVGKEVTYTSNDDDESYEPDFQSELEGPFTPEEQQWQEQIMQQLTIIEQSCRDAPESAEKLASLRSQDLKELLAKKKDNYDLQR